MCLQLLDRGADINAKDKDLGRTPAIIAACKGQAEACGLMHGSLFFALGTSNVMPDPKLAKKKAK